MEASLFIHFILVMSDSFNEPILYTMFLVTSMQSMCINYCHCDKADNVFKQIVSSILCFHFTGVSRCLTHDYAKTFPTVTISPQEKADS